MKTTLFAIIMALGLQTARAAQGPAAEFGLGLQVGSLVAVTGKYWISKPAAIDFGLGFGGSATSLYADYLWHVPGIFGTSSKFGRESSGYLGGGGGISFWDDSYECGRWDCSRRTRKSGTGIFLRAVFGVEWYPQRTRFGVFGEIGPTFLVTPSMNGSLDVNVGGRYYF